jgi:hypothetical protein
MDGMAGREGRGTDGKFRRGATIMSFPTIVIQPTGVLFSISNFRFINFLFTLPTLVVMELAGSLEVLLVIMKMNALLHII